MPLKFKLKLKFQVYKSTWYNMESMAVCLLYEVKVWVITGRVCMFSRISSGT